MLLNLFVFTSFIFISLTSAGPRSFFHKVDDDNFELPEIVNFEPKTESFRLPNNSYPTHYDISLITDIHLGNFDFFGTVTIDIRMVENSLSITVNSMLMTIYNIDLLSPNNQLIESGVRYEQIERLEFLVIYPLSELLQNSAYKVRISYSGVLRTDDYGFYRASYFDEEGKRIWLATTQFQATDARHAFPCYDEPQIRTSFDIQIRHHQRYRALSNMPVDSITPGPIRGFVITKFQRIPSMQTYLLAFTVSDFIYVEDNTVVPPQKIYARMEAINDGEAAFALEISPEIMLTCEKYFKLNYTFPKMDQIAITDFSAGAMENWGLVSYREIFLLFDPLVRTTRNKEWIITIIAHEFAHQWIGNIVSPEWWTYLWINEGFATLYEYYMPHFTYPEERFHDLFLVDVVQRVFEVDANPNIRPMSYYVEDPVSIYNLFDWIAYSKAGSVLHTFMYGLKTNVWEKGVHNFIMDRYNNYANAEHLYASIQRALDEENNPEIPIVSAMMRSWEVQSGFPLVTLTRDNQYRPLVKQERFFYDPRDSSENLWYIPINYATKLNPNFTSTAAQLWMPSRQMGELPFAVENWVILNIQQNFYYRVNYDLYMWYLIIDQLNEDFKVIHYRNRAQLIDDAFHIARSQRLSYSVLLGLMNYMWEEIDYVPWVPVSRANVYLNRWLSGTGVYPKYQQFIRQNSEKYFSKLGVEFIDDEPIIDRYARTIMVNLACRAQLQECLVKTNQELVAFLVNNRWIAPDYVSLIYCNGMRVVNVMHFLMMKNRLLLTTDQAERNRIIDGLGCTQNTDLLMNFLNLAILPGTQMTATERIRILTTSASNGEDSLKNLFTFARANHLIINDISPNALNSVLRSIATYIASEDIFQEFDQFLTSLLFVQLLSPQEFISIRNTARHNLNWQLQYLDDVQEFFNSWQPR